MDAAPLCFLGAYPNATVSSLFINAAAITSPLWFPWFVLLTRTAFSCGGIRVSPYLGLYDMDDIFK
jgi:hypothetical protein